MGPGLRRGEREHGARPQLAGAGDSRRFGLDGNTWGTHAAEMGGQHPDYLGSAISAERAWTLAQLWTLQAVVEARCDTCRVRPG